MLHQGVACSLRVRHRQRLYRVPIDTRARRPVAGVTRSIQESCSPCRDGSGS
jgi:hypothetical protein